MTDTTSTAIACNATVTTEYATPTRAERVARAVVPDNTTSITTRVEAATVVTEVARNTTGGLQSTVDDYVVNLGVAENVLDAVDADIDAEADADAPDSGSDTTPIEESTAAETTTDETTQL